MRLKIKKRMDARQAEEKKEMEKSAKTIQRQFRKKKMRAQEKELHEMHESATLIQRAYLKRKARKEELLERKLEPTDGGAPVVLRAERIGDKKKLR